MGLFAVAEAADWLWENTGVDEMPGWAQAEQGSFPPAPGMVLTPFSGHGSEQFRGAGSWTFQEFPLKPLLLWLCLWWHRTEGS